MSFLFEKTGGFYLIYDDEKERYFSFFPVVFVHDGPSAADRP